MAVQPSSKAPAYGYKAQSTNRSWPEITLSSFCASTDLTCMTKSIRWYSIAALFDVCTQRHANRRSNTGGRAAIQRHAPHSQPKVVCLHCCWLRSWTNTATASFRSRPVLAASRRDVPRRPGSANTRPHTAVPAHRAGPGFGSAARVLPRPTRRRSCCGAGARSTDRDDGDRLAAPQPVENRRRAPPSRDPPLASAQRWAKGWAKGDLNPCFYLRKYLLHAAQPTALGVQADRLRRRS
jgi:hypothetical protein